MTIRELADRFNVSPRTIHQWRGLGFPPPLGDRRGPVCRCGQEHVEWIVAWQDLHHHFVSGVQALAYCRDNGITLTDYLKQREASVREFGIGVA